MKSTWVHVLCTVSLLTFTAPAFALEDHAGSEPKLKQELKVSKPGDFEKSCGPLSQEAENMSKIITTMEQVKDKSEMQSYGLTAAGAVGSFLIGSVTGGIGLAVGGMLLDYNIDEHADNAEDIQDIAQQRRSLMMGIYNAKGCYGPLEQATLETKETNLLDKMASSDEPVYQAELRKRYNN